MKNCYNKLMLVVVIVFISAANLIAQPTVLPYKNGFESATTDWNFVSDPHNPANAWFVGTAVKCSGNKSLYVTNNGGTNANYDDTSASTIFAYHEFTLPEYHSYSIYFDWRSKGALSDSLYVCWVENAAQTIAPAPNGALPAWVNATKKLVLGGQETVWLPASFSVCGTGQPAKLVFVWTNNGDNIGTSTSPSNSKSPAGSIDNLQINQNLDITYRNGFDTPAEIAEWTLYNNTNFPNKWCFGSAEYLTPGGALYISNNGGATNAYTDTKGFSSAVKSITLPAGEQYNIDFDWMAGGDAGDYIWVGWADSTFTNFTRNGNDPPIAFDAFYPIKLNNSLVWKHQIITVTGTGKPQNLVFMWVNNTNINRQPAGVIDNIVITKTGVCPPPTGISTIINGRNITVSWTGTSSSYRLSYRNTYIDGSQYVTIDNVISPYTIENAGRGIYSFMVSGICANALSICGTNGNIEYKNDTTAVTAKHGVLVVANEGCIDYTNLTNTAIVQAQYGTWMTSSGVVTNDGLIDNGYASDLSRHTIHYVPEYDTLTNGGLRTIPEGALAAVRLGNKRNQYEWEGVTYTFTVDSTYALLIMQYAIVLEEPGHTGEPKFTLEILNSNNQAIDATCGNATFIASSSLLTDPTWHQVPSNTMRVPSSNTGTGTRFAGAIYWKEWTTVGLNLLPYRGQTIKVRLRNYDCNAGGHFGYSYFTLNCARAALSGLSCGNNTVTAIDAPDGFSYCWYKKFNLDGTPATYNPTNCISTDKSFTPPAINDTATYICRASFIAEPSCFLNLTARLAPRSPVAQGSFNHISSNCENRVSLRNHSYVSYGETLTDEQPETLYWLVTQGNDTIFRSTQENPIMLVPNEGGTYNVRLVAGLMNDNCTDTTTFQMVAPEIKPTRDTIMACVGQIPAYPNEGIFSDTIINAAGCDSILTYVIQNEIKIDIDRTICYGDSTLFEGVYYKTAGDYPKTFQTSYGCDSVRILHLQVNPVMDISINNISGAICADDPSFIISYENKGGSEATKYLLNFNQKAENAGFVDFEIASDGTKNIVVPLPANLRPDNYSVDISFVDEVYQCVGTTLPVQFRVDYPSYIIEQRWGDVIALLNPHTIVSEPRAGHTSNVDDYTFSEYQWYKGNDLIEKENGSNIYVEGGLDLTAQYKIRVTRKIDGVPLFSCAIQPHEYSPANDQPILILGANGYNIAARNKSGVINIYSVTGILISSQKFSADAILNVPTQAGVYIINILLSNGDIYKDKIIIK